MGEVVDDLASEAGAFAARVRGTTRVARFAGGAVANGFRTPYGPAGALAPADFFAPDHLAELLAAAPAAAG